MEEWRPVVGWDGLYEVSSQGRVRSLPRRSATRRLAVRGRVLKPTKMPKGHLMVDLSFDRTCGGRRERRFIHVLVLYAFAGDPAPGQISRHLDGNPENNTLDNLAWGSHQDNHDDAVRHGTFERGEMKSQAIMTTNSVLELRRLANEGVPLKDLAVRYGIAYRTAHKIATRKSWAHLP